MKTTGYKKEQTIAVFLLLLFLVTAMIIVFRTDNSFGGGDHYSHFKLARWSWKHPRLFLDEWGKPVFTLLASPFAQLGMNFTRLYNILAGALTALLSWKLSRMFYKQRNWAVILFVLFTPIYFISMFAVLTEVTFSMLLTLSILLFFKKRYVWAAIVISFFPLSRTESIVLIPLFLLAFLMKKQWKAIPFFLTGFLLYSFVGWPVFKDFLWLVHKMPYRGSPGFYGHGDLFHFVKQLPHILGYPLTALFCIGLIFELWKWWKLDRFRLHQRFYFLLLVPGSFLLYFAAHSYVWWKGIGSSLGLIRVIAAATPLAAVTAMSGFNLILKPFSKFRKISLAFSLVIIGWIVFIGANTYHQDFKMSQPQMILSNACNYIKTNRLDKYKIYYFSTFVPYKLGIDPYNNILSSEGLPRHENISKAIPDNSIIVWDAHFGPNEGRTPLDALLNDKGLRLLKVFRPSTPFKVLGGYDYAVYLFQKRKQP